MKRDTFIITALGVTLTGGFALAVPAPANHLAARQPSVRLLAEGKKEDKGEKIAPEKLPKKVVESVKKDMPGSRITKAFKKNDEGKTVYLLDDVKVGKKGWDLTVAEDGSILKKEECHDDD